MSTEPSDGSSEKSSTTSISGGVNVDAQRDVNISGDVVGRDKIEDKSIKVDDIIGATAVAIGHGASTSITNIYEALAPVITALHQLPSPPRDFTGREAELAKLASALSEGKTSIVVLQGLGGSGKTTLALKLAEEYFKRA
jgi:deoxyadenosine/deoxycytidine kinase